VEIKLLKRLRNVTTKFLAAQRISEYRTSRLARFVEG
jgi:hypothetical protein